MGLSISISFLSSRVDECVQLLNWCKVNTKIQDSLTAKAVSQMTLKTSYESWDNKRRTCRIALNSNSRKHVGEVMKWCSRELSSTHYSINMVEFKEVLLQSNAPGKTSACLSWMRTAGTWERCDICCSCASVALWGVENGGCTGSEGIEAMLDPSHRGSMGHGWRHGCKLEMLRH